MSGELTLGISYFGKLPARADFLKAPSNNHQLISALDDWAQHALGQLASDVAWKQRYDMAKSMDFAVLSSRQRKVVAGHLLPSHDQSGRRFPFLAAVSMEVPQPLAFLSRSPLAFARGWARLGRSIRQAHQQTDPGPSLQEMVDHRINVNVVYDSLNPAFQDFLEVESLGSLEDKLSTPDRPVSIRRILLGLGILLQQVMGASSSSVGKGLALPLPADPVYRHLVASLWMDLLAGFLGRADFQLLLLLRHAGPPLLAVGFKGLDACTLQAMFDEKLLNNDFVQLYDPEWVDEQVAADSGLRKLAAYTEHADLALRTARTTFRETFLGG